MNAWQAAPPFDRADIEARLCRALDLAPKVLEYFGEHGYTDPEAPQNSFRPDKAIAETAMLVYAASATRYLPGVAARVDAVARALLPFARCKRLLLNIAMQPALALDLAVPHVLLSALGYPDGRFDAMLRACMDASTRKGRERPPFAAVEQRWVESVWTGQCPDRTWDADLRRSVLYRPLDILAGLREDAYAFTHLLMYCTDFGLQPARLPRHKSAILQDASSLLARCLCEEDYDLAGEAIMAWPLMRAAWSATALLCFQVLADVEDEFGVLPGGTTQADRIKALQGEAKTRYALATAYHTAYVMGLLCAASLRDANVPVQSVGSVCHADLLEQVLTRLDPHRGALSRVLFTYDVGQLNAVALFLVDVAIVQMCRKHDYQGVSVLLRTATRHNVARSAVCRQSAELLERLALYAAPLPTTHPTSSARSLVGR